jgi:hypothetical protein
MISTATGKPTPNASTMIMTNAKHAESTGALARTSSPDISSPLEPPRASARRPKVKLWRIENAAVRTIALAAEKTWSGHERFEVALEALTKS